MDKTNTITAAPVHGAHSRPRAVFSSSDFPLIKEALLNYAQTLTENDPKLSQISSLVHRIGRVN